MWISKIFFSACVQRLKTNEIVLLSVIIWRIWYVRNQLVHGKGWVGVESIVSWFMGYISHYRTTNLPQDMANGGDVVPQLIR